MSKNNSKANDSKTKESMKCSFCNKKRNTSFYSLSKLLVMTDKKVVEVGLLSLVKNLNSYTIKHCIHLSGSEIILFRPDIFVGYLKEYFKENIVSYSFKEYQICEHCFKEYKLLVPEK